MVFTKKITTHLSNRNLINVFILSGLLFIAGCVNHKEDILYPSSTTPADCTTTPAKFTADIQPLILTKCAISGCHDAAAASGGLIFETYQQISAAKDMINQMAVIEKSMPPTGPLLPAEVSKLKCWIDGGGLNN